jgi:LmbE family N-acetylglucosaminyl deacetylase
MKNRAMWKEQGNDSTMPVKELLGQTKGQIQRRWRGLLAWLLAITGLVGLYLGYLSSPGEAIEILDDVLYGPVLVIAPHNDDEVLGAAGAIQRHLQQGDRVAVVLLTNGDGQYRSPFQSRAQAIQFGYRRQEETRQALRLLGVVEENIYFLGYPDRGLAQLWNHHWDCQHLYTSSQTGANRSPYANSFTPQAPHCGMSLVRDLQAVLERERPATIYLPHPNDTHPDHWSAHAFTLYAVEQLRREHPAGKDYQQIRLFTYLVHYGRWPMPRGLFWSAELKLPSALAKLDTRWRSLPLSAEEVERKYQAILHYRSQVQYMLLYLASFARRNELFGEIPLLQLHDLDSSLSYPDPKQSGFLGGLRGYNDIKAVHLTSTADEHLVIEVELFEDLRPTNDVFLNLKTLAAHATTPSNWRFLRSDGVLYVNGERLWDPEIRHTVRRNVFWLSLSLERLGKPQAFLIGVELVRRGITFSKAAYRLVELAPASYLLTP